MLGKTLPYDSAPAVRARLAEVSPSFGTFGGVQKPVWLNGEVIKALEGLAAKQKVGGPSCTASLTRGTLVWAEELPERMLRPPRLMVQRQDGVCCQLTCTPCLAVCAPQVQSSTPLASPISNFYMTDAISRASSIMAKCVLARQQQSAGSSK